MIRGHHSMIKETNQRCRTVLILDADIEFLKSLQEDPKARHIPPITIYTGKDAQRCIADSSQPLAGAFVNLNVTGSGQVPGAVSVVRFCHLYRPAMPVYLIYDSVYEGKSPLSHEELNRMGLQAALAKPVTYSKLISLVMTEAIRFDPASALEQARRNQDVLDAEVAAEDAEFVPIRAMDFVSGSKSFFDLYVRLRSGRYIKLLQSGQSFSTDRLANYLNKGVTHFYLRKAAQQEYLNYCSQIATKVAKNEKIGVNARLGQVLNLGEETMKFLRAQGLSEDGLQYVNVFSSNLQQLVNSLGLESNGLLGHMMSNLSNYEHGVSTAMIASLLSPPLGIKSESVVQIVGMASLLHDVGLYQLPPELHDEDESKMTPEQKKIYYTHPEVGRNLLNKVHGVSQAVLHAVAHHHERKDKKGFPAVSGARALNRVAEIIGVSGSLARLIQKAKDNPSLDVFGEMQANVLPGYSSAVVQAFHDVFAAGERAAKKSRQQAAGL